MRIEIHFSLQDPPQAAHTLLAYTPDQLRAELSKLQLPDRWWPCVYSEDWEKWFLVRKAVPEGAKRGWPGIVFCRGQIPSDADARDLWDLFLNEIRCQSELFAVVRGAKTAVSDAIAEMK